VTNERCPWQRVHKLGGSKVGGLMVTRVRRGRGHPVFNIP
jgi:hypothetical protein